MLEESSFVHCGADSRHLTTDETAEKGKTTTNALVCCVRSVDVHVCVDDVSTIMMMERKKAPHLTTKNLP
jgi:hypothetical protein